MKAISLWQPWATLIAIGAKEYETRSWAQSYRGTIAIHAAKRTSEIQRVLNKPDMACYLNDEGYHKVQDFPLGAIVAFAKLTAIYRTEELRPHLSPKELQYGDFSNGRFAWRIEQVAILDEPIPARGQQGLWDWRDYDEFFMKQLGIKE